MEYQLYINGKWKNTESGSVVSDLNPADGSVYAQVHFAGPAEVEEAVAAADHAWKSWAETPAADKEAILLKAGDWMQEHIDEVAGVLMDESGSAFGKAYFEAGFAVDLFRAAAGECRRVFGEIQQQAPGEISMIRRLPFGVVAGIVAGYLHSSVALNVGIVYGGMNLYNNGYAGGIVAIFMVPVIQSVMDRRARARGGLSL